MALNGGSSAPSERPCVGRSRRRSTHRAAPQRARAGVERRARSCGRRRRARTRAAPVRGARRSTGAPARRARAAARRADAARRPAAAQAGTTGAAGPRRRAPRRARAAWSKPRGAGAAGFAGTGTSAAGARAATPARRRAICAAISVGAAAARRGTSARATSAARGPVVAPAAPSARRTPARAPGSGRTAPAARSARQRGRAATAAPRGTARTARRRRAGGRRQRDARRRREERAARGERAERPRAHAHDRRARRARHVSDAAHCDNRAHGRRRHLVDVRARRRSSWSLTLGGALRAALARACARDGRRARRAPIWRLAVVPRPASLAARSSRSISPVDALAEQALRDAHGPARAAARPRADLPDPRPDEGHPAPGRRAGCRRSSAPPGRSATRSSRSSLYVAVDVALARPRALRRRARAPGRPRPRARHASCSAGLLYWWHLLVADPQPPSASAAWARSSTCCRRSSLVGLLGHRPHVRARRRSTPSTSSSAPIWGLTAGERPGSSPARSWRSSSRSSWASRSPGCSSARSSESRARASERARALRGPARGRAERRSALEHAVARRSDAAPSPASTVDVAAHDDAGAERHVAARPSARSHATSDGGAGGEARLEVADQLEVARVEVDERRGPRARGASDDARVARSST